MFLFVKSLHNTIGDNSGLQSVCSINNLEEILKLIYFVKYPVLIFFRSNLLTF